MEREMDELAILFRFEEVVDEIVKEAENNPLAPGLGQKYPEMPNSINFMVVSPFLYFPTASGKKIPFISRMCLPMQTFGLIGFAGDRMFQPEYLTSQIEPRGKGKNPTGEEYLNFKRDAICLQVKDVLNRHAKGEIVFEKVMEDVANERRLAEFYEVASQADWWDPISRQKFRDCMFKLHEDLERAAEERGELELYFAYLYDRPRPWRRNDWQGYSTRKYKKFISRARQLLRQMEEE